MSLEQISGRITIDRPDKKIVFSSIYNWLYNGLLNKCSAKLLRRKGKSLKPKETGGKFNIGKTIKQRPKEVRKRTSVGHWELDTVFLVEVNLKLVFQLLLKGKHD